MLTLATKAVKQFTKSVKDLRRLIKISLKSVEFSSFCHNSWQYSMAFIQLRWPKFQASFYSLHAPTTTAPSKSITKCSLYSEQPWASYSTHPLTRSWHSAPGSISYLFRRKRHNFLHHHSSFPPPLKPWLFQPSRILYIKISMLLCYYYSCLSAIYRLKNYCYL